jgi:Ca2+:H+ antiporter
VCSLTEDSYQDSKAGEIFTMGNQIQRTLLSSWINKLLVAAPVGIVLGAIQNMNPIANFVVFAIIPLAAVVGFASEL